MTSLDWLISKYPCLSARTMQLTVCGSTTLKAASIFKLPCFFNDKYSFPSKSGVMSNAYKAQPPVMSSYL